MRTRVDVSRRILGGKRECLLPGPHDLPRAWPRIALDGRTSWFRRAPANGRLRRVSPVAPNAKASDISSPPCLLRLLPAGANRRVGLAPTGKRRLVTAHPQTGHCLSPVVAPPVEWKVTLSAPPFGQQERLRKKVMPPGGRFRRPAAPSREFRPRERDPRPRGRASERRQCQQGW